MARNIENVVDAAHDPEVAIKIAIGAITGEIIFAMKIFRVIGFFKPFRIAPDGADHRRPWPLDHQKTAFAFFDIVTGFINDGGHDAGQGQGA